MHLGLTWVSVLPYRGEEQEEMEWEEDRGEKGKGRPDTKAFIGLF